MEPILRGSFCRIKEGVVRSNFFTRGSIHYYFVLFQCLHGKHVFHGGGGKGRKIGTNILISFLNRRTGKRKVPLPDHSFKS